MSVSFKINDVMRVIVSKSYHNSRASLKEILTMFFDLQQQTAKILSFRIKAKPNYIIRKPLPKLSDFITRSCLKCGKYGNRKKGFVIYEKLYVGNPDIEPAKRKLKDFEDVDVCRQCYAELCPELARFIQ